MDSFSVSFKSKEDTINFINNNINNLKFITFKDQIHSIGIIDHWDGHIEITVVKRDCYLPGMDFRLTHTYYTVDIFTNEYFEIKRNSDDYDWDIDIHTKIVNKFLGI